MYVGFPAPPQYAPETANSGPPAQARRQLANAVRSINQSDLLGPGREMTLSVDPTTRRSIVQIVNTDTREVLDQMPSERVLEMMGEASKASP